MHLHLELPNELVDKSEQEMEALALEALVVRLYALGELSSGEGADLLSISPREFLNVLGRYNVSIFDESMDVRKEAGYGQRGAASCIEYNSTHQSGG